MPLAYDGHKVSAHHKFANGTYFISSALVLKFSAFLILGLGQINVNFDRNLTKKHLSIMKVI